jgi:hypothetical protein
MFNIPSFFGFRAGSGGYDPDALAFFGRVDAATATTDFLTVTEKDAVNDLVLQMKANLIWTPMKAIYPMVGGGTGTLAQKQAACEQNLASASFTGAFSSGWTFASTGVTPNGTSATFNTGLNPLTDLSSANSNHQAVYLRTVNSGITSVDIGQNDNLWLSAIRWNTNMTFIYNPRSSNIISVPTTNSNNLSINTRRSSTDFAFFNNNSKLGTNITTNTLPFVSGNVHVGSAGGSIFFSSRQNAFASIGDGLTDTQASNLYTAVQAFQTTLSRQV